MAAIFAMAFFDSMKRELFHGKAAEKGSSRIDPAHVKGSSFL
jgi:hypothetical protein